MRTIFYYLIVFVTCIYSYCEAQAFNPFQSDTIKAKERVAYFTISAGFEIWMKERLILYDKKNSEINEYTSLERGFLSGRGGPPFISFSYENKKPLRHTLGFYFMNKKYEIGRGYGIERPALKIKSYSAFYRIDYIIDKKDRQKRPFRLYVGTRLLVTHLKYGTRWGDSGISVGWGKSTTYQKSYTALIQLLPGIEFKKRVNISVGLNINIAAWISGNYHYTYYWDNNPIEVEQYEQNTQISEIAPFWNLHKEKLMINTFTFSIGYLFPIKPKTSKQLNIIQP